MFDYLDKRLQTVDSLFHACTSLVVDSHFCRGVVTLQLGESVGYFVAEDIIEAIKKVSQETDMANE